MKHTPTHAEITNAIRRFQAKGGVIMKLPDTVEEQRRNHLREEAWVEFMRSGYSREPTGQNAN